MSDSSDPPLAVAVTGASGSAYAVRLLQVLLEAGREVHLVMSHAAIEVLNAETDRRVSLTEFDATVLLPEVSTEALTRLRYHHVRDFSAGIASGSFRTAGMAVCPCSMGTLSAIAHGMSQNLIHRAADVCLKERRKLVLVPRETPLGVVQLRNMTLAAEAGAVILPAMPGFYHRPAEISELIDFVVQRVCDQLGVDVKLSGRWST